MSDDRTIIDVFESVLGVPFDWRWTKKIPIDVPTTRRLAEEVGDYYNNFRIPEKNTGDLRPYLFHSYTTGNQLWEKYVRHEGAHYSFSPSSDSEITPFLKPFLLYSHGISFQDPLPGLLDYFRPSPEETEFERLRLPGVAQLLIEYVKIADLIRHRIVVPVSGEVFGFYSHDQFFLSDDEKNEIQSLLPTLNVDLTPEQRANVFSYIARLIKEQLWLSQQTDNRIDLYFPRESYVPIFQGLLRAASRRYNSKEIEEPFAVGRLASLACLDTSKISIADIISIRSEDAFNEYRTVLQGILQRLQEREGKFSDLESEFALAAREEMAACDDKIRQLTKKTNVLKDTLRNLDRVIIGGATGSVGGLLAASPEIAVLGAAAGAAFRPLYDIVRGNWTASPSSAARASLRHHFMVLGAADPQSES